jgi:hypothetical protein
MCGRGAADGQRKMWRRARQEPRKKGSTAGTTAGGPAALGAEGSGGAAARREGRPGARARAPRARLGGAPVRSRASGSVHTYIYRGVRKRRAQGSRRLQGVSVLSTAPPFPQPAAGRRQSRFARAGAVPLPLHASACARPRRAATHCIARQARAARRGAARQPVDSSTQRAVRSQGPGPLSRAGGAHATACMCRDDYRRWVACALFDDSFDERAAMCTLISAPFRSRFDQWTAVTATF